MRKIYFKSVEIKPKQKAKMFPIYLVLVMFILGTFNTINREPQVAHRDEEMKTEDITPTVHLHDTVQAITAYEHVVLIAEPAEPTASNAESEKVWQFLETYPNNRIDRAYFDLLDQNCDDLTLKQVVAISVAESGAGGTLPHRQSNFWGWFLGNNRDHDPDRDTMARQICHGIGTYYPNIHIGSGVFATLPDGTPIEIGQKVALYTGNDRPATWQKNFNWAFSQM